MLIVTCGLLLALSMSADEKPSPSADMQNTVRAILARFDKGDPGWKVRMESLVHLAKIGPAAGPSLIDGLKHESLVTREFAAQALVLFADSTMEPALELALAD